MNGMETDRLILRRWADDDLAAARAIYADEEVMRYIPVGVMSDEQIERMLARFNAEIDERGYGLRAVLEKATGKIIGESGLHYLPQTNEVEIAWLYARSAWGKGFATEAASAIMRDGFERRRLDRIICLIDERNVRSMRVASGLGFAYLGTGQYYERVLRVYEKKAAG